MARTKSNDDLMGQYRTKTSGPAATLCFVLNYFLGMLL